MKKWIIGAAAALTMLLCRPIWAQENVQDPEAKVVEAVPHIAAPNANHAVIQINQPFVSEVFGEMTLPFMWEVSEDKALQRLIATETRTEHPARLTIDHLKLPKASELKAEKSQSHAVLSYEEIAKSVIQSVAQTLETTAEIQMHKSRKKKFLRSTFEGIENGIPRRCAVEILPATESQRLTVLSICTHAERTYEPDLVDVIHQVFETISK